MDAALATIASLFAVIQGSVWLIELVQRVRERRTAREYAAIRSSVMANQAEVMRSAPSDVQSSSAYSASDHIEMTAANHSVSGNHMSIDGHRSAVQPLTPPVLSPSSGESEMPLAASLKTGSRLRRLIRGIWHAVLIAFLPVFAFLSPMGLAIAVLLPFRDSVADPTFYDEGPGKTLVYSLILLIPGVLAFRHPPFNSLHKWVRRVTLGVAVLIAILFFIVIAFVEPTQ